MAPPHVLQSSLKERRCSVIGQDSMWQTWGMSSQLTHNMLQTDTQTMCLIPFQCHCYWEWPDRCFHGHLVPKEFWWTNTWEGCRVSTSPPCWWSQFPLYCWVHQICKRSEYHCPLLPKPYNPCLAGSWRCRICDSKTAMAHSTQLLGKWALATEAFKAHIYSAVWHIFLETMSEVLVKECFEKTGILPFNDEIVTSRQMPQARSIQQRLTLMACHHLWSELSVFRASWLPQSSHPPARTSTWR